MTGSEQVVRDILTDHQVPQMAKEALGEDDQLMKNGIGHRGLGEGKYDSFHKMLR